MQKQIMCAGGVLFKNPKFSYSVHIMSRVQHMHKKLLSNWEIRVSQWLQTSLCSQPLMLCRLLYIILPTLQYACYIFPAQKWKWQSEFWTTFCNCIFYCHFYCWLLQTSHSPSHFGFCQPKCPWEVQHTSLLQMRAAGMRFCWNWTQQLDLIVEESFKSWCLLWSDNWQHHIMNADWRLENTIYTL